MPRLIEVGRLDRLDPEKGIAVTIGNDTLALFKVDRVIYATEAWCLRCGASLAEGYLQGGIVACSGCDWLYDVTTGSVVRIPALRLNTFEVQVVGDQIVVADA
jgi:nitrite reductase/ring-hydroxylating ferredoxin subunit